MYSGGDHLAVGFPHSDIAGSKDACSSPTLIAACRVLLRLSAPRHPPSTLSNLTIKCLELMRSAIVCFVRTQPLRILKTTTRIQFSRNILIARINGAASEDCLSIHPSDATAARKSGNDAKRARISGSAPLAEGAMVELIGLEPTTPCLQSRCSPS
jgi:hypothetical protein